MTRRSNVVEPPARGDAVAVTGDGKRTLLLLLAVQGAEDVKAGGRAREGAAMDGEDILTQAEEANAPDPVGWARPHTGDEKGANAEGIRREIAKTAQQMFEEQDYQKEESETHV